VSSQHSSAPSDVAVTVAVVSWNTRELLCSCLESLAPEVAAGRAEVVVVDNASSDASPELVRERFPWARLIESGENLGFGAAVNLAAQRSRAPWIAAANADIALSAGALERLLAAGAVDERAGILAPQLIGADGSVEHSVHPFPTLPVTLALNLGLGTLVPVLGDRLALEGRWNPARPRRVDWAVGAFLLIRRRAFEALGGFSPAHWMYAEDLDLGWRAARAGWVTRYEPTAVIRHVGGAASAQAFGNAARERWMLATYSWMWRTCGPLRTRVYALLGIAGALARLGFSYTAPALPAARSLPCRRGELRQWARLHMAGLREPEAPRLR
jgi:N-acetylglucosaminyl-diphospho-decaprenol L-rhamnosyltransferase